ncbi:flagellar assembly protein FliW [Rariglobus hedericola]|uniref:Flagellar assembly factor FliW n=1 Tax=Rariglobus hedericola TaxID=2597822 RepID=A0A556QPQ7_9BACT|nr:flagellar assembly protein FliW [Rariglobus hedericola]TSJ78625.1 flagellar assembly protein FliW [Rariglobus hedericola]
MKVTSDSLVAPSPEAPFPSFSLPQGLIGFSEFKSFELLLDPEQAPFRWLLLHGPETIQFVVIEPGGVIPDYELELFDEDAAFLGITGPEDALILNIVTVSRSLPATATVNLVSPLVINRRTGLAKQVVLSNHARFNVRHPLVTAS